LPRAWPSRTSAPPPRASTSRSSRPITRTSPMSASTSPASGIDVDKVDAIVDVPTSSVALAVNNIAKEKNKASTSIRAPASVRPHRRAVHAQHGALDLRHLHAAARHRRGHGEGRRRHLVLPHRGLCLRPCAGARHHGGGHRGRRQGARQRQAPAQHRTTSRPSCCRRRPPRPRSSALPMPAATPPTRSSRRPSSASCPGRPEARGLLLFIDRRACARPQDGAGPELHRVLLLGPERPDPRLLEALHRSGSRRRNADHGAGRRLCGATLHYFKALEALGGNPHDGPRWSPR
jgi:hypothetical protein